MIYPSIKSLLEKVDNKYSLVAMTAKRARQLVDGQEPLIHVDSHNPVTIATNEIAAGFIQSENNQDLQE